MWMFDFLVLRLHNKNVSDASSTTECIGDYEEWIGKGRGK